MPHRVLTLLWKELIDIRRDVKSLVLVVASAWLLPVLAVFSQGLQHATIAHVMIVDFDCSSSRDLNVSSTEVAYMLQYLVDSYAPIPTNVTVVEACGLRPRVTGDVVIEIPRGFIANLTSFARVAYLRVYYNPASSVASQLYSWIIYVAVPSMSRLFSDKLVELLAQRAGVNATPDAILDPVRVEKGYIGVAPSQGAVVEAAVQAAHFLAFATIFVFAPAAMLTSDIFIYDKERRNLELLLTTPATPAEIIAAKMLAASILAGLAGLADAAAITVYMSITGVTQGFSTPLTLVLVHAVSTFLAIGVTSALTALPIMLGASTRLVSLLSGIYTILAFFVYAGSLAVDYTRLPVAYQALLALIPYTYSVNSIIYAARGDLATALMNLAILAAYLLALLAASSRLVNTERIVRST